VPFPEEYKKVTTVRGTITLCVTGVKNNNTDAMASRIFQLADTNGIGVIAKADLVAALRPSRARRVRRRAEMEGKSRGETSETKGETKGEGGGESDGPSEDGSGDEDAAGETDSEAVAYVRRHWAMAPLLKTRLWKHELEGKEAATARPHALPCTLHRQR
jgi:hypothetical protein